VVVEFRGVPSTYKPCDSNRCHNNTENNCCHVKNVNTTNTNRINEDKKDEGNFSDMLLYNLSFSLPVHLRYHSPHSLSPLKPGITDISHRIIKIKNPDIYISDINKKSRGIESIDTDKQSSSNNGDSVFPIVTRIYDVSFLGQKGNSDLLDGCTYIRIPSKRRGENDSEDHRDQSTDLNNAEKDLSNTMSHVNIDHASNHMIHTDILQEINLSIPVGYVEHSYVLFVTICCYLCTASAILYSLLI
jgi:hypothetical protein